MLCCVLCVVCYVVCCAMRGVYYFVCLVLYIVCGVCCVVCIVCHVLPISDVYDDPPPIYGISRHNTHDHIQRYRVLILPTDFNGDHTSMSYAFHNVSNYDDPANAFWLITMLWHDFPYNSPF